MEFVDALEGLKRYRHRFYKQCLPIRPNAMMLLMYLHHHLAEDLPGIQPSELGEKLRLTRPTVTSLVNCLEEDGLVKRIDDEEDRRVVFVRPTAKGDSLVKQVKDEFTSELKEMMDYLGTDGPELVRILTRVRHFLADQ